MMFYLDLGQNIEEMILQPDDRNLWFSILVGNVPRLHSYAERT